MYVCCVFFSRNTEILKLSYATTTSRIIHQYHQRRRRDGWWRGTVVERRSLAGELSLSCARPAADG